MGSISVMVGEAIARRVGPIEFHFDILHNLLWQF